jgi:nucleotide-binding universal stress UspA family protein
MPINGGLSAATDTDRTELPEETMYQRILVPIDGSPTSDQGLDEAIALASVTGGSIRLLHDLDELVFATGFETGATYARNILPALRQGSERILAAGRKRVSAASVAVDALTIECFARRPCDVIVEAAAQWPADLIVIGTHGRRGVNRMMLGSDAEQVARMASVPVLLVRSAVKPGPNASATEGHAAASRVDEATAA